MTVAGTVYLHVGTAKSGTTYLQRMMSHNRGLLKEHGYLYPGDRASHFMESLSLRQSSFKGYRYPASDGAWERTAEEVRGFEGKALISHETMANTPPKLIEKAVGSFAGRDVKVLITCRDLGRQIPAAWQERVKNGNQQAYADYLEAIFLGWNGGKPAFRSVFWRTQDLAALAGRWARVVGGENVRMVTVPRSGVDPDELWKRFAEAADLPTIEYGESVGLKNASLGTAETELLRRLNTHMPEDLDWPVYEVLIKHRFVSRDLAPLEVGGKLSVPEKYQRATTEAAEHLIETLRSAPYTVIGDLEELRPTFRSGATRPEDIDGDQLLELSLQIIATMALRASPARHTVGGREAVRIIADRLRRRLR